MSRKDDNALIVFLKYPETKRVKTRLGEDIGEQRAMELYRETASFVADSFSGSRELDDFSLLQSQGKEKRGF